MRQHVAHFDPTWRSRPVVILASGPSATEEFSLGILRRHRGRLIAVKDGYKIYEHADVVMIGDAKYASRQPDFNDSRTSTILYTDEVPLPACWAEDPRIQFIPKVAGRGLSKQPDKLRGTFSTTCLAINYAVLKGAREIVLVGVDGKPGADGARHFTGTIKENWMRRYDRQRWGYSRLTDDLKSAAVKVWNANPNNKIPTFKTMPEGII